MNRTRLWLIGAVVVILAVLGLGWTLGVSPLLSQATAAETERQSVDAVNAAQAAQLVALRDQYEDIEGLRDQLAETVLSVPAQVRADYVYALLASYQASTGAGVATITLGEAVQYGVPVNGDQEAGAAAPAAPAGVPDLYTVPVTITFDAIDAGVVLNFVKAMQTGPRLLLVTSVERGSSDGGATITAYMFVINDPAISGEGVTGGAPTPEPTPEPTETPTPGATETPE